MSSESPRVVSGIRPTGAAHLGNYHGALKNWVKLQHEYDCYFFIADWHALTTHYESTAQIQSHIWETAIDCLAAGLNPSSCKLFVQSKVPEHAELFLLLSMITPLGWLERVPTYKDQQERLKELDLATYGFLGYPMLQAADILIYKATLVPVGEDQISHLELVREVARRFNHLYGKEPDFLDKAEMAIQKLGKKNAALYRELLKRYQELGDHEAIETGHALVQSQVNLSVGDRERLYGFLEGNGKNILMEPQALLTSVPKITGLDGQKMSKSYNNTIRLREEPESVTKKIKVMPTDPARIRRQDKGDPQKCPVWGLHQVYSSGEAKAWVYEGCTSAGIGCIDCKNVLCEAIIEDQKPILERAREFTANPRLVLDVLRDGAEAARAVARETLDEVREAMGLVE